MHILKENYQKLDENRKVFFLELTQDLVKIHNKSKILINNSNLNKNEKSNTYTS